MIAASSIEARLRALEEVLRGSGYSAESGGGESSSSGGPTSRLHALEAKLDAFLANGDPAAAAAAAAEAGSGGSSAAPTNLQQIWAESDKLLMELDPGSALTHQQQIAAPILYRRQQVLASADTLQQNMQQVYDILTFLSIGQAQIISGDVTPVSEMQVTKAPILTQTVPPSREDQERLRKVEKALWETQQQVESIAARMDRLVSGYHALVSAVSEKMVIADEVAANKTS